MKRLLYVFGLLLLLQPVQSHYKAKYHVIVDTDGGVDDFRAICMMLATPEIEVIAITTVHGVLPANETAKRLRSLLQYLHHEGIPVGCSNIPEVKSAGPTHPFEMARNVKWPGTTYGPLLNDDQFPDAGELIIKSINLEEMPVDLIALGPLGNIARALESSEITEQVRKIYWYNREANKHDLNYSFDPGSARQVLSTGLPVDRVFSGENPIGSARELTGGLDTINSRYSGAIQELYTSAPSSFEEHYMAVHAGDDCIPIYLLYPEYFRKQDPEKNSNSGIFTADPGINLRPAILDILYSDKEDKSIIFNKFPTDPALFEPDVAPIVARILEEHGPKEWRIIVVTNEFHEHLGVYSMLGAKMGLRAREYFNIGIDELVIESYAGSNPPVSCMNDGLQTSTGATMGHGTITLTGDRVIPKARFSFKDQVIELEVKREVREKVREIVQGYVREYGLDSTEYWDHIRALSLKYWMELSRYDIFEIRVIS